MKIDMLSIENNSSASAIKLGILTLAAFIAMANASHAASISTYINAGKNRITNGYDLAGPEGTAPGGDSFITQNATATNTLNTSWQGQFLNAQNGSTYEQTVYANSQVGHLQVRARTQSNPSIDEAYYIWNSSSSAASWQDTITLTTVGIAAGFMSFDLFVTGTSSAYGAGWEYEEEPGYFATYDAAVASWSLDVGLQGGALLSESYSGSQGGYSGYHGDPLSVSIQHYAIPIDFGVPIELSVGINAWAYANASSGESSMADISILNSLEWGGITSVLDASCNPLAFSLSSASGYDYRLAFADSPQGNPVVPLPSTVILFGSGLLGLVGFRKKTKKIVANE